MRAVRVDWADWSFGPGRHPIAGATLAGFTALSATMVAAHLKTPGWWLLFAGLVTAAAAAISSAWQQAPRRVVGYRTMCWVAAGIWAACTLTWSSPWDRGPLVALLTLTAVGALLGTGLAQVQTRRDAAKVTAASKTAVAGEGEEPRDARARRMQAVLRKVARSQVVCTHSESWEEPEYGYTVLGWLPASGMTIGDLKNFEQQLAFAADMPDGCNPEVLPFPAAGRRAFRLRVPTKNALVETRLLPADSSVRSVEDPIRLGFGSDLSTAVGVNLRFSSGVLVGQTGSGKSNTLNVLTYGLARCDDVVLLAIDLSGNGRFPRPWVRAWVEGRAPNPIFEYVAVTAEEAELMTLAVIQIINGRTAAYQQVMREANDDKIPVSPQIPQFMLLVDEFATLPESVKMNLKTITETGRGAAVRPLACALEATSGSLPRSLVTQSRVRIGMRVSDESELQYLFDRTWRSGRFDPNMLPEPGCGLAADGGPPTQFKADRIEPDHIDAASVELAGRRPEVDAVSVELGDTVYRPARDPKTGEKITEAVERVWVDRWKRTLPLMFPDLAHELPAAAPAPAAVVVQETQPAVVDDPQGAMASSMAGLDDALRQARQARKAAEAEAAAEQDGEPELDFAEVEKWLEEAAPSPAPGSGTPVKPQVRMRQIVLEHRRDGIGPRDVHKQLRAEGYPTAEQTVIGWMKKDTAAGILAQPGGTGTPYVPGPNFKEEI